MDCLICAKHQGAGPLVGPVIWADDRVVVTHRLSDANGTCYPGYLFIETRRHVASLDQLAEDEVTPVARAAWLAARALRAELNPDFVFSALAGRAVPHFHQHVFVRYQDTPPDVPWMNSHIWPGARRVPGADIEPLCRRLARHFA